jgi:hypothetical protein
MPSCWQEAISALWIGVTGHYRLTYEDKAMEAEDQLSRLLLQLEKREDGLRSSLSRLAHEAVALKGRDRGRCRQKVQEHKRTQAQLDRLVAYKDTVLVHMDALRNTELNKTLISALQESSKTLKSMGVVDGVRQVETVVSDVETSIAQVQELTALLGTPITANITVTDDELDRELDLIDDGAMVNSMEEEDEHQHADKHSDAQSAVEHSAQHNAAQSAAQQHAAQQNAAARFEIVE